MLESSRNNLSHLPLLTNTNINLLSTGLPVTGSNTTPSNTTPDLINLSTHPDSPYRIYPYDVITM